MSDWYGIGDNGPEPINPNVFFIRTVANLAGYSDYELSSEFKDFLVWEHELRGDA